MLVKIVGNSLLKRFRITVDTGDPFHLRGAGYLVRRPRRRCGEKDERVPAPSRGERRCLFERGTFRRDDGPGSAGTLRNGRRSRSWQ
jgi:hypothetical protein